MLDWIYTLKFITIVIISLFISAFPLNSYADPDRDIIFSDAGVDNEQEAIDFFTGFQRAVANHEKVKVADMVCYPVGATLASGERVTLKTREEFLKRYDSIFDTMFIENIAELKSDELGMSYSIVTSGDHDEIWFHKQWQQKDCKGTVKISSINNVQQRNLAYLQAVEDKKSKKKTKKGRVSPEEQTAEPQELTHVSETGVQGVILGRGLSAIRKRVETADKVTAKRIYGKKKSKLPKSPVEEAAVMQLALNTKSIIPGKDFIAECSYSGRDVTVYCQMYFPGEFLIGGVPQQNVSYIESVASNAAQSFRRGQTTSFDLEALVNVEGNYVPVCRFMYNKNIDQITPIYMVR